MNLFPTTLTQNYLKMKKIESFREVWQLPLHIDENSECYVFSDNGVMALTFATDNSKLIRGVISRINGESAEIEPGFTHSGTSFYYNGRFVFHVRGWGYLVGGGALRLPQNEAARIQDQFINYIQHQLDTTL